MSQYLSWGKNIEIYKSVCVKGIAYAVNSKEC